MKRTGKTLAILIPAAILAAAAWGIWHPSGSSRGPQFANPHAAELPHIAAPKHCPASGRPFIGVSAPAPVARNVATFAAATGIRPSVVEYYSVFGDRFDSARASIAVRAGAVPLMQWLPSHIPLKTIAAGREDRYIRQFASDVRAFRCPIMLSFAHEMNGPWWPWGRGRQLPVSYRLAWQRIYGIFKRAGTRNAIWVWNPNAMTRRYVAQASSWWPGRQYVNIIALDGYYWNPGDTFASIFDQTLAAVRSLAPGMPVMIAETGVYPGPRMAARIQDLIHGVHAKHLAGFVYFDHDAHHANWRLEDHLAVLPVFRAAATALLGSSS